MKFQKMNDMREHFFENNLFDIKYIEFWSFQKSALHKLWMHW